MNEQAIVFDCKGASLLGVLHNAEASKNVGVVIVVAGGPQYRVGVSRQFVNLSRLLSSNGIPVLRFDHRGTGDSQGQYAGYVDMADDIRSAIDVLMKNNPQLERVVLWGECESATALSFYGHTDDRVSGLFMVNPWIRTDAGEAKTYIKHYYLSRLSDKEFWQKVFSGKFAFGESIKSFFSLVSRARKNEAGSSATNTSVDYEWLAQLDLPERVEKTMELYQGKSFILTSGNDLIAQEFKDHVAKSEGWQKILKDHAITLSDIAEADHSFSRSDWREILFNSVLQWVQDEHA